MSITDATTRFERIEKMGTEKYLKLVDMGADLVVNRPIGSQTLSKSEQKKRYQENRANPQYQQQLIGEFFQTRGFPKGLVDYVEYVEEMMKDA